MKKIMFALLSTAILLGPAMAEEKIANEIKDSQRIESQTFDGDEVEKPKKKKSSKKSKKSKKAKKDLN